MPRSRQHNEEFPTKILAAIDEFENVALAGRTAVDVSVRGVSFSPILYRRGPKP